MAGRGKPAANWNRTKRFKSDYHVANTPAAKRPRQLSLCECGYSKPCCQEVQRKTAGGPLLEYPNIAFQLVTVQRCSTDLPANDGPSATPGRDPAMYGPSHNLAQ